MTFFKKHSHLITLILIAITGLFLRLYKIDFGRPQSFLYDENDIYDDVIRISQNYKFIIAKDGWEGFKPTSYVYGMFPTYFLILSTMIFNKTISILHTPVDFDFYFVYMRIITSLFSFLTVIFASLIYKEVFKDKKGTLLTFALTAVNWKLIVQSHYLNHDTFLAALTTASLYFFATYLNNPDKKSSKAVISALILGLTAGTKITGLIIAPAIGTILIFNKDWKGLVAYFVFTIVGFSVSNPFSIIYFSEFFNRMIDMRSVEAGIIFGDINNNPLRYLVSFFTLLTPAIFILSFYSIFRVIKQLFINIKSKKIEKNLQIHLVLIVIILTYLIFYSLTPRLTERWMVPIIPIFIIYASKALMDIFEKHHKNKIIIYPVIALTLLSTTFFTFSLMKQLEKGKPRVKAYIWFTNYLKESDRGEKSILMYTNKGYRDPFARIKNCNLISYQVYEAKEASSFYPKDPFQYDYVILYSTMEKNYENKYIKNKYPEYYKAWSNFTETVKEPRNFRLLKEFKTIKPDLIGIPEFSIYENIKQIENTN